MTVAKMLKKMVKLSGGGFKGTETVAEKLDIHWSYIYILVQGKRKPGKRLLRDIHALYSDFAVSSKQKRAS